MSGFPFLGVLVLGDIPVQMENQFDYAHGMNF